MNGKTIWVALLAVVVLVAAIGGYIYLKVGHEPVAPAEEGISGESAIESPELMKVQIHYPLYTRLHMVEKSIPRRSLQTAIAEAVIEEFLKGFGDGKISHMPRNVRLLGLYKGPERILYIDLSEEFHKDFQGGALSEYLILSGLYETLISNLREFHDFKILIEGREIESLGGHFYLKYSLKHLLSSVMPSGESVVS